MTTGSRRSPDLNVDLIAKTALAVADDKGAEGFTLRAVADELGVTAMALYHHVADKSALVSLVIDASLNSRPLPEPTGVWQDDLWEMAHWTRQLMLEHPAVGRLMQINRVWTPSALPIAERWLSIWQQSGLPLDESVTAAVMTSFALHGFASQLANVPQMSLPDDTMLSMLPNARLVYRAQPDYDAGFELVVRALIEGVHARLQQQIERDS